MRTVGNNSGNMATKRTSSREDVGYYAVQENTGASSNVPAFLMKLWTLVEDPASNDIICWDVKGKSFHIFDQARFAQELLPVYFKHNNVSSFIRQLNMYGFRKVVKVESGGLKVERDDLEFQHVYFQRGQEHLLEHIKRRQSAPMKMDARASTASVSVNPDEVSRVLSDVTQIKGKQDNISATMSQLRKENEALWREVAHLRQAQMKQQRIVNKLLHFLMSLANSRTMPGLQRKRHLMINSAPDTSDASLGPSPAKAPNIRLDEGGDHDYTVQSPPDFLNTLTPNTSGVVIQELLEPTDSKPVDLAFETSLSSQTPTAVSSTGIATNLLDQALLHAQILPEGSVLTQPHTLAQQANLLTQPSASLTAQAQLQQLLEQHQPQEQKKQQQQQQQQQRQQQQKAASNQVALRGVSDQPLSSSGKSVSAANRLKSEHLTFGPPVAVPSSPLPKDVTDQIDLLQSDIEHVRELLSTGQFSLDPSFLTGLFDPDNSISVNVDQNFLDALSAEDLGEMMSSSGNQSSVPSSNITGQELWQYQPPDNLPDLFEDFTADKDTGEEETIPVYFDKDLETPRPDTSDIKAEELD